MEFLLLLGLLALYMLPWFVAAARKHPQVNAIGALTILLGWTFIGWAVAVVWSLTEVHRDA
jgi:hypothetical protein